MSEIMQAPKIFVQLVGLPGAGKSTFRAQFKGQCVQLSTDDLIEDVAQFRGLTYSDVFADEIKPATSAIHAAFKAALKDGASIMWDQTNLTVKKRKGVLSQVPDDYHKIVIVVKCDEDVRQERLKNRPGKHIPPHIDENMRNSFVHPTLDEGWDEIMVVNT